MKPRRVVVLGAGITGLCAAYEITRRSRSGAPADVVVLEASSRAGGKVMTKTEDGVVFEAGPDSFLSAKPEILDLAKDLGLSRELIGAGASGNSSVQVYSGGRLRGLWGGLWPPRARSLFLSGLLSWRGKLRLALSPFIRANDFSGDQSLACFVRARFGEEVLEKIAGPLLAGIYAGDPELLSLESTFPRLGKSLSAATPGRSLFMSFRGGLSRLTDALALALPGGCVRTGVQASSVRRENGEWAIETSAGSFRADAVVCAISARDAAPIVAGLDPEMSSILGEIPFASTATVSLLYPESAFARSPAGFGFLAPRNENLLISAATYSSSKFEGRAPKGTVLIRCFIGGAGRDANAQKPEDDLVSEAAAEISRILRIRPGSPPLKSVARRWIFANPQYTVGHGLRLRRLESCLKNHPGLILAGCSYRGVGLPDCARSGLAAGLAAAAAGLDYQGLA
ncbi:MAG: protoporphyrinogen oxidase [Elusimicrobiota bacterium]